MLFSKAKLRIRRVAERAKALFYDDTDRMIWVQLAPRSLLLRPWIRRLTMIISCLVASNKQEILKTPKQLQIPPKSKYLSQCKVCE